MCTDIYLHRQELLHRPNIFSYYRMSCLIHSYIIMFFDSGFNLSFSLSNISLRSLYSILYTTLFLDINSVTILSSLLIHLNST